MGNYRGKRLIFKNCKSVQLICDFETSIHSSSPEEGLVFESPLNVKLIGNGLFKINKGVTIWKDCVNFLMEGCHIHDGHTGFRCNQEGFVYKNITLHGNIIERMSKEGIYIGSFFEQECMKYKTRLISINGNVVRNCLWDGIQVGNTFDFMISGNDILNCALAKEYGQDFQIIVNPGSRGKVVRNNFKGRCQFSSLTFFEN